MSIILVQSEEGLYLLERRKEGRWVKLQRDLEAEMNEGIDVCFEVRDGWGQSG